MKPNPNDTTIERANGTVLRQGTLERSAWAAKLEKTVADLRAANNALAARSEPVGPGSMPGISTAGYHVEPAVLYHVDHHTKDAMLCPQGSDRKGKRVVQYLNIACPACGAEPGFPCNTSIALEDWENVVHQARIRRFNQEKGM